MGDQSYLIRYGVMQHVGRFTASPACDGPLERGQLVVIQTDRGIELGEVLIAVDALATPARDGAPAPPLGTGEEETAPGVATRSPHVMRVAGPDDLLRSRSAEELRSSHFSFCQRILREGDWPWELVDVEPLLDGSAMVLHYLGPHHLDAAPARARFRALCDFDVVFEPVGNDVDGEFTASGFETAGAGGCGSCGCSDGGGCAGPPLKAAAGHHDAPGAMARGCASNPHTGCASCGIQRLLAERTKARA